MASIRKRGKGYQITVSKGRDISGKQILETTTFIPDPAKSEKQQQKDLEKFILEFEDRVKNGNLVKGDKLTLKAFSEQWMKTYAEKQLATTTLQCYDLHINNLILPALGHIKLTDLKPMHIQSFLNNLTEDGVKLNGEPGGYSSGSIKKSKNVLSKMLNTAVQWQLIESNPCNRVVIPKDDNGEESLKYFTMEQVNTFLNALEMDYTTTYKGHDRIDDTGKKYSVREYTETRSIPTQFKILFYIAIFGGLRRGELIALTWSDIDFDSSTICITKSTVKTNAGLLTKTPKTKKSTRTIKLPDSVMKLIKRYKIEQNEYRLSIGDQWVGNDYLFIQWNGSQMYPDTPYKTFHDIIDKYNATVKNESDKLPKIPFHGLRHTSATLLIAENVDVCTVSARLGHAQTSTTMNIYAHALEELDSKAANALENIIQKKA